MAKKIFFVGSYPDSLINFRLQLMLEFCSRGYEVVALAPRNEKVKQRLAQEGIRYIEISLERNGLNPLRDLFLLFHLIKIFRKERPEINFLYTIKPVIYGALAAKLTRVPYIYSLITGTGYVFLNKTLKGKMVSFVAKVLFRVALKCSAKIFFQNKDNLAFFRQENLIAMDQAIAVVNGSGVDCEHFSQMPYPSELSFLMIARLLYDKGLCEYVSAARQIRKTYPQVKFYVAGWIDTNPNAIKQEELDQWVCDGDIEFLGKLSDVRPVIANASVYVLPSYHEGMPRTVLEAMAMGRPIITTDAPGCREAVIPDQNGFLVPIKNVPALVGAMKYFIENPENIPVMGIASRKIALEKYDVYKVNSSILEGMGIE